MNNTNRSEISLLSPRYNSINSFYLILLILIGLLEVVEVDQPQKVELHLNRI